jgi:polyhydroxybutyrate depolymerase
MRVVLRLVWMIAVGAVAVAGCSSGSEGSSSPPASAGAPETSRSRAAVGVDDWITSARPAVTPRAPTVDGSLRTPDGRVRTYHLYVPSTVEESADAAPVPLLVALHGGTGSGRQFERTSGFDGLAESNRFVVVYPDGIGVDPDGTRLRTWNGGACCGPAARLDVDDVGFVEMLIDAVEAQQPIDPDRVFAAGHSNGGILAYRLACELSDRIAAIGVQSASLEIDDCAPSHAVSVLHIHGDADQNLPIIGGRGPASIAGVSFHPPREGFRKLATEDGCAPAPTPATRPDPSHPDLMVTTWKECDAGAQVAFVTVSGAPHQWMGHPSPAPGVVGEPYQGLDSSRLIWGFLDAQSST